jgi:hypothetical protein
MSFGSWTGKIMQSLRRIAIHTVQCAVMGAAGMGFLMVPADALAGSETKLTVTATVLKRASLKTLAQPSSVTITAADIARGYVDVPAAAQVAIQNNSLGGYLLEFAAQGDFMRQIMVKGLANDVQLSPAGGAVMQPSSGSGVTRTTLALGFRFMLSESTQQGTYPWPMRLSVTPL